MVVAHWSALPLPLLFALLAVDPARATGVEPLLNLSANSTSELYNAFDLLNVTVGGRLHTALPFERACFSIVEGKHVNVSEAACAALQANYTNPVYRVEHFGAYMLVCALSQYHPLAIIANLIPLHCSPNGKRAKHLTIPTGACSIQTTCQTHWLTKASTAD